MSTKVVQWQWNKLVTGGEVGPTHSLQLWSNGEGRVSGTTPIVMLFHLLMDRCDSLLTVDHLTSVAHACAGCFLPAISHVLCPVHSWHLSECVSLFPLDHSLVVATSSYSLHCCTSNQCLGTWNCITSLLSLLPSFSEQSVEDSDRLVWPFPAWHLNLMICYLLRAAHQPVPFPKFWIYWGQGSCLP